jgi:beta-barrel assembly-enhancing protease
MGIPIPEFKVLLYGPRLPAAGLRARAHFECNNLVVKASGVALVVPAQQLRLKPGGFDGHQWLIAWVAQEGAYSAMLQGEEALEAFIQLAPADLGRQLHRTRRHHARDVHRFSPRLAWLVLLLLVPLLLLLLFWANADRISLWAVSHISLEQERQLGKRAYDQLRPSLRLVEKGVAPATVAAIGKRLTAESIHHYHFLVAADPRINAYALPGGHIVVNTGLLQAADSAGEVAGVLAHEISHVEQRHALRSLLHALGWRALLGVAMGDFSGGVWSDLAVHLGSLNYSRALESEADQESLLILRRAGVAAHGMESFFTKLATRKDDVPPLLSSHPASVERLEALRAAISRQPADGLYPLGIDWERIKAESMR